SKGLEISAAAYKHWHFDLEGLPADLIRSSRPESKTRIKTSNRRLPIYDSDGLLIWEAIQNSVQTYINQYYPDPSLVCNDIELQAWYAEVINVGHADVRYENWWPTLANAEDLTATLTIIIWLASAQHAALNFGQYPYVVDTLSTHSPDEEYIGERQQRDTWSGDAEMVESFYEFASEIQRIEKIIEKRNLSSEPGVTCRGIPNSVSI
ncbi:linoleate 13S-lipoxygenase 3-1, chloroplastic-like protein, partial [Tanacetum coccineum]